MADITVRNQGNVSDEGQVNWRGDQVSVVPGDQSIYDTASIQLTDLGSRKVVGDRVFRYALSGDTIGAGLIASRSVSTADNYKTLLGTSALTGAKQINIVLTTSAAANFFAEGYVHVQSGSATKVGYMYKIKSHGSIGDGGSGVFTLYDPIKLAINSATDKVSVWANPYARVILDTDETNPVVGVAPIAVVSGDYFWLQTWGPCCIEVGSAGIPKAGGSIYAGSAGMCETTGGGGTTWMIGYSAQQGTSAEWAHCWLTVAP